MISVWWFANRVTYHIDAERNPTGSIVGRTPNNEGVCRLQTFERAMRKGGIQAYRSLYNKVNVKKGTNVTGSFLYCNFIV